MSIHLRTTPILAALATLSFVLAGCTVKVSEGEGGNHSDVDIRTPAGDLSVRSLEDANETGLPVYPGAREAENRHGRENASVDVGTPWVDVKVAAAKYESDDAPDRIQEFYRDAMSRYGDVVECRGDVDFRGPRGAKRPVCKDGWFSHEGLKLVVGPEHRQRIVAIKPHGDYTEFSLVYVATSRN